MITLQAAPGFRRGVLLCAAAIVLAEIGLFALLWRLGTLTDPGADRRTALAFVALGTALTLQAMAMVGAVWISAAMAWTTLRADGVGLSLEHPWRRWHGHPSDIARAWQHGRWLVLELRGHWRRWYVRTGRDDGPALDRLRGDLPAGTWLDAPAARAHLMRNVLPLILGAAGVGGLLLVWGLRVLDGLLRAP